MPHFFETAINSPRARTIASLAVIVAAVLAMMIPFAGQAFSIDGPLELDYAQMQVDHPLAQGLPDFDSFGIHYDNYLNTHPRFLTLYLSLVIRAAGGVSEVPIHLSLIIFPIIGGISMFWLGRRFRVSGLASALLFLVSPMIMVNAHMETVDVPGVCLWLAAIAVFIGAVDKRDNWLLAASALLMILTTQTFFQGLSILPLALAYLVIKKRFRIWNFVPIAAAGVLFGTYLLAVYFSYNQFPRFSYRAASIFSKPTFLTQLRGNLTVLGATIMLPVAAFAAFFIRWTYALVLAAAAAGTWAWCLVKFETGAYTGGEAVLLSVMLPAGIAAVFLCIERVIAGTLVSRIRRSQEGKDAVWLALWSLGVIGYAVFLLPYPASRYILPALPPLLLLLLMAWRGFSNVRWLRFSLAAAAIGFTLVFSVILSVAYRDNAENAKIEANWVQQHVGGAPDHVWYDGGLGFQYYMAQKGFKMLPNVQSEIYAETSRKLPLVSPRPGDYVVSSRKYGQWMPYPDTQERLRRSKELDIYNHQTVIMDGLTGGEEWWASLFLPFQIDPQGGRFDDLTVWTVDAKAMPLPEDTKRLYATQGINLP